VACEAFWARTSGTLAARPGLTVIVEVAPGELAHLSRANTRPINATVMPTVDTTTPAQVMSSGANHLNRVMTTHRVRRQSTRQVTPIKEAKPCLTS
jgi:hypothetical protein